MSLPVTGNVQLKANASEAITSELATGTLAASLSFALSFANGTGANNINEWWTDTRTLAVSTPVTLTASALTDGLGRTVAFTKIRLLMIKNNGTADLIVGGATAPVPIFSDASDKIPVRPGGVFLIVAPGASGIGVTATTADGIKLDPGSTACPIEVLILGE
jgi:hypothetical protein